MAVDFFTAETIWLQRLYALFLIELGEPAGASGRMRADSERAVVTQHARQLTWTLAERPERVRVLIRDRDQKFTHRFDEVFGVDWIDIVPAPSRALPASGVAERFVRTARSNASIGC